MRIKVILVTSLVIYAPVAWTQPKITITKIETKAPSKSGRIVKFCVNEAPPGSGYETGSLHIVYSDGTEVIQKLPPKQESTKDSIVFNEVGINAPKLADDMRTIAWTEDFDNYGTSYSIPLVLGVYRSGKNIVEIQEGQMVWKWTFVDGGKRVAAEWGPVHSSDIGDYQLYDSETGAMIDEVFGDAEVEGGVHGLAPNAPKWAKELEKKP